MKKTALVLITVIIFALLTGCTSDFKVNDVVVKDISDKITQAVIENIDSNIDAEKQETHTLDATNSAELIVKSEVGDIIIMTHDSNEIVIDANIKAKSNTKERAEELVESFKYSIEEKGKKISIDTTGYNGKTISDEIIVDLIIKIPSSIETTSVTSNVGDINFENINGTINSIANVGDITIKNSSASYDIKADVGDVELRDGSILGESIFYLNVGDINVTTNDISMAESLSAETKVGDIKMSLPENSNYEADIREFMQEPRNELAGTGKTKIKLITDVGNIDFE